MTKTFFELSLAPSAYFDLFADFALELTGEAIEELELPHFDDFKFHHITQTTLVESNPTKRTIIIRTQEEPSDLIARFEGFCAVVGERVGEEVGFGYKLECKDNEDWIGKYKAGVTPIECAGFYIRPSWYEDKAGLENLIIDPALAFGSGHHATTFMCVEMLSKLSLSGKNVLDVGCGSGILSLVAKKKGAVVHLCDTDSLAVEESKKNFSLNGEEIDEIWEGSLRSGGMQYDVVVANILADIIKVLYYDFYNATKRGSIVVLSGILEIYKDSVLEKFRDFELCEVSHKDEWVALKLMRR